MHWRRKPRGSLLVRSASDDCDSSINARWHVHDKDGTIRFLVLRVNDRRVHPVDLTDGWQKGIVVEVSYVDHGRSSVIGWRAVVAPCRRRASAIVLVEQLQTSGQLTDAVMRILLALLPVVSSYVESTGRVRRRRGSCHRRITRNELEVQIPAFRDCGSYQLRWSPRASR